MFLYEENNNYMQILSKNIVDFCLAARWVRVLTNELID